METWERIVERNRATEQVAQHRVIPIYPEAEEQLVRAVERDELKARVAKLEGELAYLWRDMARMAMVIDALCERQKGAAEQNPPESAA